MKISNRVRSILTSTALLVLVSSMLAPSPVRADVAPPESPPGVIISPGSDVTQVRMVSEVVTLTIISGNDQIGKAKTSADFLMRNIGPSEESMDVRFPLTFGEALYTPGVYPEIKDFKAQVDGSPVTVTRVSTLDANSGNTIPWASFPVKFPAGKDVKISAIYTAQGFGYEPFLTFRYILETGAGWKGTIGVGDIIIRLPFASSQQNVLIDSGSGFSQVAGGPVFSGNDVSWHFENLEPTTDQNFQFRMVSPVYWNKILAERQNTSKNPQDGEAWGRLGKAIKETIRNPKGDLRDDDGGKQLYAEASQAYQKAVTLLPKDAQWHYGYADLLWSHYLFNIYYKGFQDNSEVIRLASEIQSSLQINPNYQEAKDLALSVSSTLPWVLSETDQGFKFLVLTATPTAMLDTPVPTNTIAPSPKVTKQVEQPTNVYKETATPPPAATPLPKEPALKNPLCGSVLVLPLLLGLLWYISKKH
jgi:hypothetical protein